MSDWLNIFVTLSIIFKLERNFDYIYTVILTNKSLTLAETIRMDIVLDQWFSTFFNSRHTKVQKNFGGTLIPKKIANLTKRGFFS